MCNNTYIYMYIYIYIHISICIYVYIYIYIHIYIYIYICIHIHGDRPPLALLPVKQPPHPALCAPSANPASAASGILGGLTKASSCFHSWGGSPPDTVRPRSLDSGFSVLRVLSTHEDCAVCAKHIIVFGDVEAWKDPQEADQANIISAVGSQSQQQH